MLNMQTASGINLTAWIHFHYLRGTLLLILQFHNTAWDCTFGKDAHSTPESCLSPFMGEPVVDPTVLACLPPPGQPWKPEQILKDTDKVLKLLEQINEWLGVADH